MKSMKRTPLERGNVPPVVREGDHEVDGVVVGNRDGLDVGAAADVLIVVVIPLVVVRAVRGLGRRGHVDFVPIFVDYH